MPASPRISVICPVYNGQRYLRESLESVLAQTHENFELIVWDDGSSDGSREIAASLQDARIRRFANANNKGLFPTLNLALAEARGEIVRLWCQDDVMRPTCLETEQRLMQAYPDVPLAYSYYDVIDSEGHIRSKRPDVRAAHVKTSDGALQIMFFHGSISGNIANLSIRRQLFKEVGPFREDLIYAADFEFLVRVAQSRSLCCITEPLLFVRSHAEQFSQASWAYRFSMLETEHIYQSLIDTLPREMDRGYLRNYHWFHRRMVHLHHMVRLVLSGKIADAKLLYSDFRQFSGNRLLSLFANYVVTANHRWCPERFQPRYVREADRYAGLDSTWYDNLRGPHYKELVAHEPAVAKVG
jgi:glycosyltransferase involved in cell wall biosynthesis